MSAVFGSQSKGELASVSKLIRVLANLSELNLYCIQATDVSVAEIQHLFPVVYVANVTAFRWSKTEQG